ncbi:unknown [Akkermansia muciniphila CAG:154]|nr:unknown [Akkermansia muciniphila CAG:154]
MFRGCYFEVFFKETYKSLRFDFARHACDEWSFYIFQRIVPIEQGMGCY